MAQEGLRDDSVRSSRVLGCALLRCSRCNSMRRQYAEDSIIPIIDPSRGRTSRGNYSPGPDAGRNARFAHADFHDH